jgi:glucose/arabinose dehydrogenase
MKNLFSLVLFFILTFFSCAQQADSEIEAEAPSELNYTLEVVIPELNNPWGMVFLPDSSILFTEKSGELFLFKDGLKTAIEGLPEIYVRGQGGLLDLELHPNYKENGWIYLSYSSPEGDEEGGNTAIMRAKLEGHKLVSKELLYKAIPNTKKGQHWGSRIEFDNEGYLYFSIGERGERDVNPQDLTRDGGKIYRLYDDGTIPEDNPFIDIPGAKKAIYSYGHRNPQGLVLHPETGVLWEHEHGPKGGDEINTIQKGKNYGWPVISYGLNYSGTSFTDLTEKEGMEQPVFYWTPSIAPCGMTFVTSDLYPDWKGNLLVGSLKFKYLERLILKDGKVIKREKLFENTQDVRNVRQAPDGYIYFSMEGTGIVKIIPKTS